MESCLDNSVSKKCLDDSGNGARLHEEGQKLMDNERKDHPEVNDNTLNDKKLHNQSVTHSGSLRDNVCDSIDVVTSEQLTDTCKGLDATAGKNKDGRRSSADEECATDGDATYFVNSEGHFDDQTEIECFEDACDLMEKPENWNIDDIQPMELCEAVNDVYRVADCVCISDDLVDGHAVATSCKVQGQSDVIILHSGQGLEDIQEFEDESTFPVESSGDIPIYASDDFDADGNSEEKKFYDIDKDDILLKEISEEDDSFVETVETLDELDSKAPLSLREICLAQVDVIANRDVINVDSHHIDIEGFNVQIDSQCREVESRVRTDEDNLQVHGGETESDFMSYAHDEEEAPDPPNSNIVLITGADLISIPNSDNLTPGELQNAVNVTQASGSIAAVDPRHIHQSQPVMQQVVTRPPAVSKDCASGDAFKEPGSVMLRQKNKSKRVDSIRKSLIKLGSFGKEHGNGKTKSKKEKSTDCDSALMPLLCVHG